jgi:hypothetical protein
MKGRGGRIGIKICLQGLIAMNNTGINYRNQWREEVGPLKVHV